MTSLGEGEPVEVREFRPSDLAAVERCLCELQDFGRARDQRLPAGSSIATGYLGQLQQRCTAHDGRIFVALLRQQVIGYVCVLACVPAEEPADGVAAEAQIVDLVVTAQARGQGAGRQLLAVAEAFAAARGARWLRVRVFAWNAQARSLYEGLGFTAHEIALEKDLAALRPQPHTRLT